MRYRPIVVPMLLSLATLASAATPDGAMLAGACTACHGPRGEGIDSAGYPALAGQFPAYTVTALKAFRDGSRDNDPNAIMSSIAARMSDSDMQQVAEYLHGLR